MDDHRKGGDGDGDGGIVVRVGNSTNGVVYNVRLASNDLIIDELREELLKCSDIPLHDQILLGGPPFARLDPRRTLSRYGLPASDKRVFLYDRRLLMQEHALPPRLGLEPVDVEMPTSAVSSSESSRLLSESSSPMVRALAEYESHFQLHLAQSEALERSSIANVRASERCVKELHVQADAIAAAIANLEIFCGNMSAHFTPFYTEFETAAASHESLLSDFESHLAALQTVELHPALRNLTPTGDSGEGQERKTLYDCVPADREREWAKQCEQSHQVMHAQVAKLKKVHDAIHGDVGGLVRAQRDVSSAYADTTQELTRMRQVLESHHATTAKLAENAAFVTSRLAASATAPEVSTLFASSAMLEVCRDIEVLAHEQHGLVPAAQRDAEEIKAAMAKLSAVKATFFTHVHATLRRISVAQSQIHDFENSVEMLREAMLEQKKQFHELDHLAKLPASYAACLKEVARRVRYGRTFSDRIQSMAEELAQLRDDEVHQREVFLRHFGQHLPTNLVPGLAEKPSHCEFRMRPFDQSLPQIEDDDESEIAKEEGGAVDADGSVAESKDEDEFFETRASDGLPGQQHLEGELSLRKKCEELQAQVAALTLELQQSKTRGDGLSEGRGGLGGDGLGGDGRGGGGSSYFSDGSLARSDLSKTSAREGDSSYDEFPLVLALAATAGALTSSSEADRSNLLERELQTLTNAKEIQERTRRETQLQDNQAKLQQTVRALQLSVDMQRSALVKVLQLLDLLPTSSSSSSSALLDDPGQFVTSHLDRVEAKIRALTASADTEHALRRELARKSDEIDLLESQHLGDAASALTAAAAENDDSFKISFRGFTVNDLALFLPTSVPGSDAQRVYLAFHHGCPHRFLSEESISSFMIGGRKYPDYVVGRIVFIDEATASDAHNPYGLHNGTTFYVLTVASLQDT